MKLSYNAPFRILWFGLAAALVFLMSAKIGVWLRSPNVADGDRKEVRQCRQCGGSGKDEDLAKEAPEMGDHCRFCSGSGKVTVVIPGPNHPIRVVGVIVDESKTDELDTYEHWRVDYSTGTALHPTPKEGVVSGAKVSFKGPDTVDVETGEHGLITAELRPGTYEVTATKDGFGQTRGTLVLHPITGPIWHENATMIEDPSREGSGSGEPSTYLLVTLSAASDASGRIVEGSGLVPSP